MVDLRASWLGLPSATQTGLMVALAVAVGCGVAVGASHLGTPEVLAVVLLPVVLFIFLQSLWMGLAGVIAVLAIVPFAVLLVGAAVTPTLLELAVLALLSAWLSVTVLDRRLHLHVDSASVLVLLMLGTTGCGFLLGVGRGYTPQTLHDYGKFVLAIAMFWPVYHLVTAPNAARHVLHLLLLGISGAAGIAMILYAVGPGGTLRVLVRLVPYGYPGSGIVRFIEDNPANPMRAIGTSVDPNAFGGLMMVGFVLAVALFLVEHPVMSRWVSGSVAALSGVALLLSYSRGAWVGSFAGILLVVLLRRRWMLLPLALLGVGVVAAGVGSGFITRLWLGFTLQDPATKLRLAEYRNAWEIIQQHPWFGVGFGNAGSVELQAGVSSIYLTIAERAGLVGLLIFLVTVGVVIWQGLRASIVTPPSEAADLTLCFTAAFAACLTVGLVDHYFFNPQFSHMVALFWIVAGVVAALSRWSRRAVSPTATSAERVSSRQHRRNTTRSMVNRQTSGGQ